MLTFALAKMSAYAVLNLLLYFYVSVGLIFPVYKGAWFSETEKLGK